MRSCRMRGNANNRCPQKVIFEEHDADKDNAWSVEELQHFAKKCNNGTEMPEDEIEQMREAFTRNEAGNWTFEGILELYSMQTPVEPEETWKDLLAHGFDRELKRISS
eukprot:TRINITY_DN2539_c0_g1_i1.p1 TRINITY_DN2539_c0_g1~~TRINITY_DN2539_c0_g1_i1.p1  ORF type:complete len:108 (-),score=24.43 TRINITY_DN2539_c0_g1_i1:379-702(-)